ncbi:hypothetical protein [Conexibacter sp. DBS9H8]|uniref:TlpA family protein disulfide reductase n=1 Tax=Conexibacter sp. DBS9H8 TaxID=2937801 RepID=UPI0020104D97|nr:hypothetical protein [Conexibacter sp. DBS9H8]
MTVATVLLTAGLAVALLFIVALLRSHAEILRRLMSLEAALGDPVPERTSAASPRFGEPSPSHRPTGGSAPDIFGETLAGDAVKLSLDARHGRTLLAFLSSGCQACRPLWSELPDGRARTAATRVVLITKGTDRESPARLAELAPANSEVIMSTAAWRDFAVPSSPHFVLVDGGEIAGRGAATSWEQIASLLADAGEDHRVSQARNTSQRAARAEHALARAGIGADHPSLYPSRKVTPGAAPDTRTQEGDPS